MTSFLSKDTQNAKLVLFLSSYSRLPVAPYLYDNNFFDESSIHLETHLIDFSLLNCNFSQR